MVTGALVVVVVVMLVVLVTSVTSAVAVTVLQLSSSAEVLLTNGGPVVRTKPVLCSLVQYEPTSVPCWF